LFVTSVAPRLTAWTAISMSKWSDHQAAPFEVCADLAIGERFGRSIGADVQRQHELLQRRAIAWRAAFRDAIGELGCRNARDADVANGMLAKARPHAVGALIDDVDADIGVEQVLHFNRARFC
jgi:hypothetical protein